MYIKKNVYFQDTVVCLPAKLASSLGNINPICVCYKVTAAMHLIDPNTLQGITYRAF